MAHLNESEIASMAEGNIKGPEHEKCLKHLSECEICFKIYTNTMKFVEEERKRSAWWRKLRIPGFKTIRGKLKLPEFRLPIPPKVLIPVTAVLIVILLAGTYIMTELRQRGIRKEQVQYLTNVFTQMEMHEVQSFSGTKGEIMAAFRTGVFLEDLSLLVKSSGQAELKSKIRNRLIEELKTLTIESGDLFQEVGCIERKNDKDVIKHTIELLKRHSYLDLFQFGRLVELRILESYENKIWKKDIDKYLLLSPKYDLPQGVTKELKKLDTTPLESKKIREVYIAIKYLFLFSE